MAVSIVISIVFSIALAIILELFIYLPLRQRKGESLIFLISSLGIYVIIQNLISLVWGDNLKSLSFSEITIGNEFFGAYVTNIQITTILVSVLSFFTLFFYLNKTLIGRKIKSISSNTGLATIFGVNSDKIILITTIIGSGLASIAGILVGFDTGIKPTMGFNLLLYGIVAMIIGGVGSLWGILGGSLLLATAQHLGAYYIDSQWMDAITFIILILFLLWKPLGFSGKQLKKVEI